jgi:hypothetical protein
MVTLNFGGGRYYTYNGTLVAVHKLEQAIEYDNAVAVWWGHELVEKARDIGTKGFRDDRRFYWDEKGNCISVVGTVDAVGKFDLDRGVNPMTYAAQIECVDCEECRRERRGKNVHKFSKVE